MSPGAQGPSQAANPAWELDPPPTTRKDLQEMHEFSLDALTARRRGADQPTQDPRAPACLDELQARYEIPELPPLLPHFMRRPALPQILVTAADELKRRFEDTRLTLLAREDDRFIITVETALEVEDAGARLTRFRREWWHSRIEVDDRIVVKLRYI